MSNENKESYKVAHGLRLMSSLDNLLKCRIVCDFTIRIGSTSLPVHRAVLAACSEYFRNILSGDADEGIAYINGMEPGAMEVCITFMYTGEAEVTLENVESILNAADLLQLDDLIDLCFNYMRNNMTADNCLGMRNIVAVYENQDLRKTLERFIDENMKDVVDTNTFKQLEKPDLKHYLRTLRGKSSARCKSGPEHTSQQASPRIFLSAAKARADPRGVKGRRTRSLRSAPAAPNSDKKRLVAWSAVINWIGYDYLGRKQDLPELLKYIKITRYPIDFLASVVWVERLLQKSASCKDIIASRVLADVGELRKNINLANCFHIYEMATMYTSDNFKRLIDVTITFLAENLAAIKKRREVELWTADEICMFFGSCDTCSLNEDDLWTTALTWFKGDKDRKEHAFRVVKALNVHNFSPLFVLANVLKESIVKESHECVEHVAKSVFRDRKLLIWNMDLTTCFTLKYLSRKYKSTIFADVGSEVLSYFIMNFLKVVEQTEFRKLSFDELLQLCKILQKRNIHGEAKWKAIIKWIKYDPDLRKRHLPSLLKTISFERLTSHFMKETVRQESLVDTSPECTDIVISAVFDMLP